MSLKNDNEELIDFEDWIAEVKIWVASDSETAEDIIKENLNQLVKDRIFDGVKVVKFRQATDNDFTKHLT